MTIIRAPILRGVRDVQALLFVGEMANDALILGHRILPKRAQECGYVFRHPGVDEALASAVRGSSDSG